ncbi:MAG: hypothetical protein QHC65_18300, partial [Sphingomonas sp.]
KTGETLAHLRVFTQPRSRNALKIRIVLADEAGVGKALSPAASVLMPVLLGRGAMPVLAPCAPAKQWRI